MKTLYWAGASLDDLKQLPEDVGRWRVISYTGFNLDWSRVTGSR